MAGQKAVQNYTILGKKKSLWFKIHGQTNARKCKKNKWDVGILDLFDNVHNN